MTSISWSTENLAEILFEGYKYDDNEKKISVRLFLSHYCVYSTMRCSLTMHIQTALEEY